jgi:hypothetical protein
MSHDPVFRISNGIRNSVVSAKSPSTNSTTSGTAVSGIEVRTSVENSSDDDSGGDGGDGGDNSDASDGSNDYITYDDGTTVKQTARKACGGVPRRLLLSQNGSQKTFFPSLAKPKKIKTMGQPSLIE